MPNGGQQPRMLSRLENERFFFYFLSVYDEFDIPARRDTSCCMLYAIKLIRRMLPHLDSIIFFLFCVYDVIYYGRSDMLDFASPVLLFFLLFFYRKSH